MSFSIFDAEKEVLRNIPNGKIIKRAPYKNLFVFLVDTGVEGEKLMDPYYCVDKNTGEFRAFSIFNDATPLEMVEIFND